MLLLFWLACDDDIRLPGGEGAGDGDTPGASADVTYHEAAAPILERSCVTCHTDGNIAPFSLDNYEDAAMWAPAAAAAVSGGSMPPWPPADGCADYTPDRSISAEDAEILQAWADAGAPPGDPADAPAGGDTPQGGLSRVDVTLTMEEAFTPAVTPDEYRCFLLDWTEADAYVTGFRTRPGNSTTVHHVIAYGVPPDEVAIFQGYDDADPGQGYECFSGPDVGNVTGGAAWLGGWVPGSPGEDYPEGTGIKMEEGSLVVIQIHYALATWDGEPDQSVIELKISDDVEKPARIVKLLDPSWPAGEGMLIPAGDADVTHEYTLTNVTSYTIQAHSVGLHMHQLGTSGDIRVTRADGSEECLLDIPRWDFHWQGQYFFSEPIAFEPDDSVTLRCTWDNSAGSEDVSWGENTSDEMCLGLLYVTGGG